MAKNYNYYTRSVDLIDMLTSHLQNRYKNALIGIIPYIFRNFFAEFRHSVNSRYLSTFFIVQIKKLKEKKIF